MWFDGNNPIINCYYEKSDTVKQGYSGRTLATGIDLLTINEINEMNSYIDNNPDDTLGWKKWEINSQGYPRFK